MRTSSSRRNRPDAEEAGGELAVHAQIKRRGGGSSERFSDRHFGAGSFRLHVGECYKAKFHIIPQLQLTLPGSETAHREIVENDCALTFFFAPFFYNLEWKNTGIILNFRLLGKSFRNWHVFLLPAFQINKIQALVR